MLKDINLEDHWQFVQGGIENGEKTEDALIRELAEETGSSDFVIKQKSLIDYEFIRPFGQIFSKNYFFLFFVLCTNEEKIKDTEEACGHKFVGIEDLVGNLHPVRRPLAKKILPELKKLLKHAKINL